METKLLRTELTTERIYLFACAGPLEKRCRGVVAWRGVTWSTHLFPTSADSFPTSTIRTVSVHPRVCFQLEDTPTRILHSATRLVPRLNYYLPPLAELHTEEGSDLGLFVPAASSDWEYRLRTSTIHPLAVPGESQIVPLSWVPLFSGGYAPPNR